MEITLLQIILVFLISSIIGIDSTLDEFQFHRPLISCTLIGLILGDIHKGIVMGGSLEMVVLGWMNVGAALAPDVALASVISTIIVILGNQSIGTGIALAVPLAAAGQILAISFRTITILFQHIADRFAEDGNLTGISWMHVSALCLQSLRISVPATIGLISVNTSKVQNILALVPEVITKGLNIAGSLIVVVGYAMLINMMQSNYYMPFFYLGFVIAAFTNFNLVAFGIIGIIISIIYIQLSPKYSMNYKNNDMIKNSDDELD